jgi:hypothetical protein
LISAGWFAPAAHRVRGSAAAIAVVASPVHRAQRTRSLAGSKYETSRDRDAAS